MQDTAIWGPTHHIPLGPLLRTRFHSAKDRKHGSFFGQTRYW